MDDTTESEMVITKTHTPSKKLNKNPCVFSLFYKLSRRLIVQKIALENATRIYMY